MTISPFLARSMQDWIASLSASVSHGSGPHESTLIATNSGVEVDRSGFVEVVSGVVDGD